MPSGEGKLHKPSEKQYRHKVDRSDEIENLQYRLEEVEDTLRAIREGEVDAIVVEGRQGTQVYTLTGVDYVYHTLVDEMCEGAITLSADRLILYSNRRFAELLKTPLSQIIGSAVDSFILPLQRELMIQLLEAARRGSSRGELTLQAGDGSMIAALFSVTRLDLEPQAFVVVITDLTQQKRHAEISASEKFWKAVFEASNDSILLIDQVYRIRGYNSKALKFYGYTSEELLGMSIKDLRSPEQRALVEHDLKDFVLRNEGGTFETEHVLKNGRPLYVEVSSKPFKIDNRVYFVHSVRDITRRKQTEMEIRSLNQELERRVVERTRRLEATVKELEAFSYTVSHDLRAPLRAIGGFAGALAEDYAENLDATGRRYLRTIQSNASAMGRLVDDLLTFSRLSRAKVEYSTVDMRSVVEDVLVEVRSLEPGRVVRVHVSDLPNVKGDTAMIRQVWMNLISNAFKFTRKTTAPVIQIAGREEQNEATYCISDNGMGFDMKFSGKLYGVFQRLHTDDTIEGSGIGLSIVKRIIDRHGGRVWAEGEKESGAKFFFSLPR